jgi:hypothetical protein
LDRGDVWCRDEFGGLGHDVITSVFTSTRIYYSYHHF